MGFTFKIKKETESVYKTVGVTECLLSHVIPPQSGSEEQHLTSAYFQFSEEYDFETHHRTLYLSQCDPSTPNSILFAHSAHCPFVHLTPPSNNETEKEKELLDRGLDIASCLVIERFNSNTGEKEVLITKRHKQMRQFPNIWVVPGGHVEKNESLVNSAVRELKEEVGIDLLKILTDNQIEERVQFIGGWESVFPPQLPLGYPRRHHFVAYFLVRLEEEESRAALQLSAEEVEIAAWINSSLASSLVSLLYPFSLLPKRIDQQLLENGEFEGVFIGDDDDGDSGDGHKQRTLRVKDHLTSSDCTTGVERISTATLFILSQWLSLSSSK